MSKVKAIERVGEGGCASKPRADSKGKKGYRPPSLDSYGDLRTQTLGGSPGVGDSGFMLSQEPPI